jgi:hypothetical protein
MVLLGPQISGMSALGSTTFASGRCSKCCCIACSVENRGGVDGILPESTVEGAGGIDDISSLDRKYRSISSASNSEGMN